MPRIPPECRRFLRCGDEKFARRSIFVRKSGRWPRFYWHRGCVPRRCSDAARPMWKKLEGSFVSLLFAGTAFIGAWWGAHAWLPSLASRHGAGIDAMLNYLLLTTGVLF